MNRFSPIILALTMMCACALGVSAKTTKSKTVDSGGSGPYKAIVCAESTLTDYTIYRPKDLAAAVAKEGKLPLLVWGNGACSNSNLGNERMLNEIASRGYVVVAVGPYRVNDNDGFVDNGSDGKNMTRAVDWIVKQKTLTTSEYYDMIDTEKIAASGHSCGGAEAMYTSTDKRVSTIIMCNSGMGGMSMGGASPQNLKSIHGPILYIVGGPDDVAYGNALQDYDNITVKQPVCFMTKNIGHGGTFWDQYGGDYGKILPDWLDWVFKGKKDNIKIFRDGKTTRYSGWTIKSKNMPLYFEETAKDELEVLRYMQSDFTLPKATDKGVTVTWQLEETHPGYVSLTDKALVIVNQPLEALTVGRLIANITYEGKTSQLSKWITLAPADNTYGVLFSYVNPDNNSPAFAYAKHSAKKLSYAQLATEEPVLNVMEIAPLNNGIGGAHIYRDIADRSGFVMTCNDEAADTEETHSFSLLKSKNLVEWTVKNVDVRNGKKVFLDSTKVATYTSDNRYKIMSVVTAPRLANIKIEDRKDTLPYLATYIMRSSNKAEKNTRIFYSHIDSTFTGITQPRLLYDPQVDVLDAVFEFCPYDSLYHALFITKKADEQAVLYHATSKTLLKGTWDNSKRVITDVKNPAAIVLYRAQNKAVYNLYTFSTGGTVTHWQTDPAFNTLTKQGIYTRPGGLAGEAVFITEDEYNSLVNWETTAIDTPSVADPSRTTRRYSLLGIPVGPDFKGIVIENGRKVMRGR